MIVGPTKLPSAGSAPAPVEDELAIACTLLDPAEDALLGGRGDDGADLRLGIRAVADDHGAALLGERGLEGLVGLSDRDADRVREATLPGCVEGGGKDAVDRGVEIGVGQHDDVVLRPAERLDALSMLCRRLVDVVGHGGRADEGDAVDAGVLEQRVDRRLPAVHEVDDAGRHDALQELEHPLHGERVLLRRLADERVPARDGERQEPHWHHEREVERRDRGEDADRLADHVGVDPARDVLEVRALHQRGDAGGDLDALDAAPNLAGCVLDRLAVVAGDEERELVQSPLQPVLELEACAGALDRRRRAPARERVAGGPYRLVDVRRAGERHRSEKLAVRRVRHVERLDALGLDPAASDVVLEGLRCDPGLLLDLRHLCLLVAPA